MKAAGSTLSDKGFATALLEQLEAGKQAALCSVLSTRGSMPRPADARMALFESGAFVGTIGGGRIELLAQQQCRALLDEAAEGEGEREARSELRWFTHADTGMMCGGDALVAVRLLGRDDIATLQAIVECAATGGMLVEDWSCSSRPTWRVVPGSQCPDSPLTPTWDGENALYTEPLNIASAVYVYGAGHVSQALAPVLASLGFGVRVLDERAELTTAERFPDAERLQSCRFDALAESELPSPHDYAIIMTPSHKSDYAVLEQVMRRQPTYVGCIGSRGKTARFHAWLAEAGFGQGDIDTVHMPIGDPIGAVTPAEIAISIAAEIVRFRSTKR